MKKYLCYLLSICLFIQNAYADLIWTTSFGQSGSGDGLFKTPYGIRIHPITGDIWVADSSNSRLQVFKNDHSFSKVFNTTGYGDTKPVDLVFEPTGKMYVGDFDTGYIQVYDNSGNKVKRFYGDDNLKALGIDTYNQVYTTNSLLGGTVSRYDQYGNQEKIPKEYCASGITIGPDNYIYYVEGNYHYLLKYDNNFKSINAISLNSSSTWMNGIDHGYNGKVYIANTDDNNIIIVKDDLSQELSLFKDSSNSFNKLRYIIGDKHGKFYVSDTGNNRIVVLFDPTAWTEAGTAILGTLNLKEDLTLNSGYNLKVQPMVDTTSGSVLQSDGKLTLSSNKTITLNSGSTIEASSLELNNGNLVMNQDMSLNMPITLNDLGNSIDVGTNVLSLAGIISGTGKLSKQGSGTLVLSGANTFSGGTKLYSGKTIIDDMGSLGTGDLYIVQGAELKATSQLRATKAIEMDGGTIYASSILVASGAKLKGTGYLLSSLINNGVVAPGSSPGIIKVSGDYTQNPQGTLEIYIRPSSNPVAGVDYSQLNVNGTANIGGNLLVDGEYGDYTEGVRYDILKAAGEINGKFDNVILNTAGVYNVEAYYHLHDVWLQLSKNYLPHFEHLEENRELATYINSLNTMSPAFIKAINPMYDMSHDGLRNSLSSIVPDRHLVANYISQDMTHLIHNINNARLDRVQNRLLSYDSNNMNFSMGKMSKTLLSNPTKSNLINQITSNLDHNLLGSDRHAVWVTPFVQFMNVDTNRKNYGYDAKIGGMVVGYDYKRFCHIYDVKAIVGSYLV